MKQNNDFEKLITIASKILVGVFLLILLLLGENMNNKNDDIVPSDNSHATNLKETEHKVVEIYNKGETSESESGDIRYDYPVHPLLAQMPEMNTLEFNALCNDIYLNGQRIAITLQGGSDVLLDGRSRIKVCKMLGIEPKVTYFSGTEDEIEFCIISQNDRRRQDSVSRRACKAYLFLLKAKVDKMIVKAEELKISDDNNKYRPIYLDQLDKSDLRKSAATLYGISDNSVGRAKIIYDYNQEYFYNVLNAVNVNQDSPDNGEGWFVWDLSHAESEMEKELNEKNNLSPKQNNTEKVVTSISIQKAKLVINYEKINEELLSDKLSKISDENKIHIAKTVVELFINLIMSAEENNV